MTLTFIVPLHHSPPSVNTMLSLSLFSPSLSLDIISIPLPALRTPPLLTVALQLKPLWKLNVDHYQWRKTGGMSCLILLLSVTRSHLGLLLQKDT